MTGFLAGIPLPPGTGLYLLTFTSALVLMVSVLALMSGWTIIFQNIIYFPIIIACAVYIRKGFFFSLFLIGSYRIDPYLLRR